MSIDIATPFKVYSCRLECSHDYTDFVVAASKVDVVIITNELSMLPLRPGGDLLPDTYVEFCSGANLATLQGILRKGVDLHVALQTLREVPIKHNSLERDYNLV